MICTYRVNVETLARIVRVEGDKGLGAARAKATETRQPIWRVLASRYALRWEKAA